MSEGIRFISLSSKNLLPNVKRHNVVSLDTADCSLGTKKMTSKGDPSALVTIYIIFLVPSHKMVGYHLFIWV